MYIRVLSVDDCHLLREGIKSVIDDHDDIELVGQAGDGQEAIEKLKKLKTDVVIMDINMPQLNGIKTTKQIADYNRKIRILALSAYLDENLIMSMLEAGASGYVTKDCISDELINAIRAVYSGRKYLCDRATEILVETVTNPRQSQQSTDPINSLTKRESQMVKLVAQGFSSKQIAYKLGISVKTVDGTRRKVREKLNLNGVADVTRFAIKKKLVQLNETAEKHHDPFVLF